MEEAQPEVHLKPRAGLALVDEEVERRRGAGQARQQAMRLAAVVGLVVEEMHQRRLQRLLDVAGIRDRAVAEAPGEVGIGEALDVASNAAVLGLARRAQLRKIVEQDGV